MLNSQMLDSELTAEGIHLPRARLRNTRPPHLTRPLTSQSLPPEILPLKGQKLTRGAVCSPTAQMTRNFPAAEGEPNAKSRLPSFPGGVAGRDSMPRASTRLWGERGPLAMEEDKLESLAQPIVPGDRSSEIDAPEPPTKATGTVGTAGAIGDAGALENWDDVQLVSAAQSGDAAAFDILMLRHTSKLYGLVFHMSSSHEDTDDLLQEIWAKVYRSLPSFRGASRFSTWIHSIAVNMTLNFLKKRNRRTPVSINAAPEGSDATIADLPGIDAELEDALVCNQTPRTNANRGELQKLLSDALDELTPEHRAVVTMFDIQGMAHAEIAKVMGISEGTVRSRLFYAHRQLQSYLSDVASDFLQTPSKNAL